MTSKNVFYCLVVDIDECASQPCVHGECEDRVDGFTCHCDAGWTGKHCDVGKLPSAIIVTVVYAFMFLS